MRTYFILFQLFFYAFYSNAQIPEGYYDSAEGLTGDELREALMQIIDDQNVESYGDLWTDFQSTDVKPNGEVWDMYSDIPGGTPDYTYTFVVDQCGNYSGEGDCYNREHSFPKSWFGGEVPPMYTDLFHLVPTDGYVNGQRGNYPYGEVANASWTSTNGSKRGACSYPGYTGTVFEPIDEYKGDFARGYFYMLTRYMNLINGWNSDMLSGDDFSDWARTMLLEWAANDTVSQKEIDRNNEIYAIQENRNPFIDHPEYAQLIWDLSASVAQTDLVVPKAYYQNSSLFLKGMEDQFSQCSVYSISGQLIYNARVDEEEEQLSVDLKSGLYILRFNGKSAQASVKLWVLRP
jgi:endonuclease I